MTLHAPVLSRRWFALLAVAIVISMSCAAAWPAGASAAGTWFVAPSGDDANDCRSAATPCRTIGAAIGKASGGDTIVVAAGTYAEHLVLRTDLAIFGAAAATTIIQSASGSPLTVFGRGEIGQLTLTGGVVVGAGGGITNYGTLLVTESIIRDNSVTLGEGYQGFGGGVFNSGTLELRNSTISGNTARGAGYGGSGSGWGGGIYNGGTLTMTGSTVSGNSAHAGGGIYNAGAMTVTNSTISGNQARDDGGGLVTGGNGTSTLAFTTIAENAADSNADGNGRGGGIAAAGRETSLAGTIVAANRAPAGHGPDCVGALVSQGSNLIENAAECALVGAPGTDIVGRAAGLGPLADQGGATATHALEAGSPAIDAVRIACPAADQRGVARPQGAACDIGAFEAAAPAPPECPCRLWGDAARPATLEDPDRVPVELGVKFRSDRDGYITGLRFYKGPGNTGAHTGTLWTAAGQPLATATFADETASGWQQVSFAAPVPIAANTTYVASYHTDIGRYAVDEGYFAGKGHSNGPLHALADGADGGNGVYKYGASGFPTETYRASNYWVDVDFVEDAVPTPPECPCRLWDDAARPATLEDPDRVPVELGVKFRSDRDGYVTGVRFYKGPQNTGTHTGTLWSAAGEPLATATFTGETAEGWQQVGFAVPVPIQAGTTYVASYHTGGGRYSVDEDYFAGKGHSNGPLHALADGADGGNGVYKYGASGFPTETYRASNYWVDVDFVEAVAWQVADLGTLGGDVSIANGINNRGEIVGASTTAPGQWLQGVGMRAFVWRQGIMTNLGTLPGGILSQATAINDHGGIVGDSHTGRDGRHAVLWQQDGQIIDLGTLGGALSSATDINNLGQVVGNSTTAAGPTHAFLWQDGVMTDLGTLGGASSTAVGINDRGEIVGYSQDENEIMRAVLWRDGVIVDLGGLPGGIPSAGTGYLSRGTGINDRGEVVGAGLTPAGGRAFVWREGIFTVLDPPPDGTSSIASAINDRGHAVGGSSTAAGAYRPVLWNGGSAVELGTLPGAVNTYATAINDHNHIVGTSGSAAGTSRAVLWRLLPIVR